jgi:hypothetical protein
VIREGQPGRSHAHNRALHNDADRARTGDRAARRSEDATMTASLDFDSRFLHSMISVADVPSIPDESEG